ncbi:MAG: glycosyltransferase family 39 protein [Planctomycetes bacterium]|nr:glycosyltransferase family 39 protein [Planctomycetota bacterium]
MRVLGLSQGRLYGLLAAVTAGLCAFMPVFSQEAYYWTYAQHPDLSYFDHPPMVAWLIWLGGTVFGDGAIGIRFGTWLCGLGTTWFGMLLLRDFAVDDRGQRLWILLGLASPVLLMTHFLANPDPPLVCFWTLTMLALWRARSGSLRWWLVAGVAAGAALLSKYSGAFLAVGGGVGLLADPALRRQLRRPGPYLGVAVAAIVFLPVVVWNAMHDFESFRFQTSHRLERAELGGRWLAEFALGQFGVLHPALMLLLVPTLWWLAQRWRRDTRAVWLLAFGLPLPLYLLANSLWIQVKINWVAPAYVPLLLAVVVAWRESGFVVRYPRLHRLAASSLWIAIAGIPLAPAIRLMPAGRGSSCVGWEQVADRAEYWEDEIDVVDGVEGNVFFFAADYKDAAQLGRSLAMLWESEGEHEVVTGVLDSGEVTMAQNVMSRPALQYDHWTQPSSRGGQDAIFVLPRPQDRVEIVDEVRSCFDHIDRKERVSVRQLGIHVMDVDIFVCQGYLGPRRHG